MTSPCVFFFYSQSSLNRLVGLVPSNAVSQNSGASHRINTLRLSCDHACGLSYLSNRHFSPANKINQLYSLQKESFSICSLHQSSTTEVNTLIGAYHVKPICKCVGISTMAHQLDFEKCPIIFAIYILFLTYSTDANLFLN